MPPVIENNPKKTPGIFSSRLNWPWTAQKNNNNECLEEYVETVFAEIINDHIECHEKLKDNSFNARKESELRSEEFKKFSENILERLGKESS